MRIISYWNFNSIENYKNTKIQSHIFTVNTVPWFFFWFLENNLLLKFESPTIASCPLQLIVIYSTSKGPSPAISIHSASYFPCTKKVPKNYKKVPKKYKKKIRRKKSTNKGSLPTILIHSALKNHTIREIHRRQNLRNTSCKIWEIQGAVVFCIFSYSCLLCTVSLCKVRRAPYCPDIYFHISISMPAPYAIFHWAEATGF